jgi:hypothetical protein
LPTNIRNKFYQLFKSLSDITYTESDVRLSVAQLTKMPDIIFVMEGLDGKPIHVKMPWTNYVDSLGGGMFAYRIYLTEGSGSVLGANFMNLQNVVFDRDGGRVGFAPSTCVFEDFAGTAAVTDDELSVVNKTVVEDKPPAVTTGPCKTEFSPTSICSAHCDAQHVPVNEPYRAEGIQKGVDSCMRGKKDVNPALPDRACHELCDKGGVIAAGASPACLLGRWSDCFANCSQWRISYTNLETCGKQIIESRPCNMGACPIDSGLHGKDYMVIIDMRINIPAVMWSYAYANTFEDTISEIFMVGTHGT